MIALSNYVVIYNFMAIYYENNLIFYPKSYDKTIILCTQLQFLWVYYKNNLIFYSNQLYKYNERLLWDNIYYIYYN